MTADDDPRGFETFTQKIRAFQESRILLSAIELDIFTAVGEGAGAVDIAGRIRAPLRSTTMMLDALVAIGMLSKHGGVYRNGPVAGRHLCAGATQDRRAALRHLLSLWTRWSTLTDAVRAGTSVAQPDPYEPPEARTEAFIAAMHANVLDRAPVLLAALDLGPARRMLDVGGGSGGYAIAFARGKQDLAVEVLDLPNVIAITQRHIDEAGLGGRVRVRAGDMNVDDFGTGFDLVLMSQICHMNGPETNRSLFHKAWAALEPRGRLVVQDFILEADRTAPPFAAVFAINMLVGTREGATYTAGEYKAWMVEAGFEGVEIRSLPGPTALVLGKRPA